MRVPWGQRAIGALFAHWPRLGVMLGDLETRALETAIADVGIERPVYICGLARSGSTILLEALHAHPAFTAHHYSDYPAVWTPYWWNALRTRLPLPRVAAHERAHGDGIVVTPDSPEAFEEVLWMHFFPSTHDPAVNQELDASTRNPAFEAFYVAHLRKLLAVRGATRYLAKGNYNLARIGYIRRLFDDARFIIPVRDALEHVASLVRQDRLFCRAAESSRAIAAHLARIGHYEFGPQRRAQNLGSAALVEEIAARHADGDDAGAYALQWTSVHGALLDRLETDRALANACHFVRHASLCEAPHETLRAMFAHAGALDAAGERVIDAQAGQIRAPRAREAHFDAAQQARLKAILAPIETRLHGFILR